jgi:hypothetical protein
MRLARHLYKILSWGTVALGAAHMLTTAALRGGTPAGHVWFFGTGIAIVLSGSLNLLNIGCGAVARGIRWLCIGNNVFMTGFAVVAGVVTDTEPWQLAAILSLVGGTTALSILTVPLKPGAGTATRGSGS